MWSRREYTSVSVHSAEGVCAPEIQASVSSPELQAPSTSAPDSAVTSTPESAVAPFSTSERRAPLATICTDIDLDVIEPDPLSDSDRGASARKTSIVSPETTGRPSDSGVPSTAPAPGVNVQSSSESDTPKELSSESSFTPLDVQLKSEGITSVNQSYPSSDEILQFTRDNNLCNTICCEKTGLIIFILTMSLAICFTVLVIVGKELMLWSIVAAEPALISLVFVIMGFTMYWYGTKGRRKVAKFLSGKGNIESVTKWLACGNPLRNVFHVKGACTSRCCKKRHGIERDPNSQNESPDPVPEGHHERLRRIEGEKSHRRSCPCSKCCQWILSGSGSESD